MSNFDKNILLVGQILKPIGINGTVKIRSFMSVPSDFLKLSAFQTETCDCISVSCMKHIGQDEFSGIINGIKDRCVLDKYRLKNLYVSREFLLPLKENEYYFDDLQNLTIYDKSENIIGKVRTALDYGAGSFLEIALEEGRIGTIPFNKNAIVTVDLHNSKIVIDKSYLLI